MSWLRLGDEVVSRWGIAEVTEMDLVISGEKYGEPIGKVPWEIVSNNVVVTLSNGHWAYGDQIEPVNARIPDES